MQNEIYCGSFCVKYVLDELNIEYKLNNKMFWASELANCLNSYLNKNVTLYYYKSLLVNDYYKLKNKEFAGFKYLEKYLNNGGILQSKKFNKRNLKNEIDSHKYIILCVESKRFHNNKSMDGGHYVLIVGRKGNIISIINPQKNSFSQQLIKINKLIKCSKKYGSWRILIDS